MNVTVVGAGHYARNIVGPKYAARPQCRLRAVISPRMGLAELANTSLGNLPLVRSPAEWKTRFGVPSSDDLFDLCVHVDSILPSVEQLLDIGASKFVLPKPIATRADDLHTLERLVATSGVWATVASQWHYSEVTRSLRTAAHAAGSLTTVSAVFSQNFTQHQLMRYSPATALLPHMLQILHTAQLWIPQPTDSMTVCREAFNWRIHIGTGSGVTITLETDLRQRCQTRRFVVAANDHQCPVEADFLGVFRDGEAIRFPSLSRGKATQEIREDNVDVMLDAIVTAASAGSPCLSLETYRPVADMLLQIVNA